MSTEDTRPDLPGHARAAAEAAYRTWRIGDDGEGRLHAALVAAEPLIRADERKRTGAKLAVIAEHRNAACAALRIAETLARYPAGDEATAERYRAAREALEGSDDEEGPGSG